MDHLPDAYKILEDAELSLRSLIERALSAQHYSNVAVIARIADAVAHLRRGDIEPSSTTPASVSTLNGNKSASDGTEGTPPKPSRGRRVSKAAEFPRFERDGDKLVKIGWSKRDNRVYEHRAPRETVFLVTNTISTKVKPRAIFTMDQVLPVNDNAGNGVPSYQAYLALAWLRSIGVVQRKGKDGYALTNGGLDTSKLQRLWKSVPDRQ
jgi:hypothetical protein